MRKGFCGNEYRSTIVCVDSYAHGIMSGHLYNPAFEGAIQFGCLMEFLLAMDDLFDQLKFPRNFSAVRSFRKREAVSLTKIDTADRRGKKASFVVKVLFRENASWQGSVIWLDEREEESFRSALELVFLLDSALTQGEDQSGNVDPRDKQSEKQATHRRLRIAEAKSSS